MKIRSQKDFAAGVMFVIVGTAFAWLSTGYRMGTAAKMGPGYFPFWLGVILAVLGVIVALGALSRSKTEDRIGRFDIKSLLWITGAVTLFGLLLKPLGLLLSLLVLVFVAAMASHEFSWKWTLANAAVLIIASYLAFVKGLSLQFPVWPAFIGH